MHLLRQSAWFAKKSLFLAVVFSLLSSGLLCQKAWALPGDACSLDPNDPTFDPLVCNICNGERCELNPATNQTQCANFPFPLEPDLPSFNPASQDPACPSGNQPGCWNLCDEQVVAPSGIDFAVCRPNADFCQDISGGMQENACRSAVCSESGTLDVNNPSGCEYELIPATQNDECRFCSSPLPADFSNCGNGICERAQETFANCPLDCRVPGFEGDLLVPNAQDLNLACGNQIPALTFFEGPVFNIPNSGHCEDGDVCTQDVCQQPGVAVCTVTPSACSGDVADFCCPAACEGPPTALTCAQAQQQGDVPPGACDIDCYLPQSCIPPVCGDNVINQTSEQCDGSAKGACQNGCTNACKCVVLPSPEPVQCLQGSSFLSGKGKEGCGGWTCSLQRHAADFPLRGTSVLGGALVTVWGGLTFARGRKSR